MNYKDKLQNKLECITEEEAKLLLNQIGTKKDIGNVIELYTNSKKQQHIKLGVISDTHIGHNNFNYTAFETSVKKLKSVDYILHCGDIIEGMSTRPGHIYELSEIGVTNQVNKAVELLKEYEAPIKFILGNHDLWAMKKADQGYNLGYDLESKLPNSQYMGDINARLKLNDNLSIDLNHTGNSSYALSYSSQKLINSLEGGTKPQILLNGHLHKLFYMLYRNIHSFDTGCFQNQTEFMKMKGSASAVGFFIIDIKYTKKGIVSLTPELTPFY